MKANPWWLFLALGVAASIYVEWHTDEVTVVLALLLICAAALGALRPASSPIGGAILGFSILAAHAVTEAAGTSRPHYLHTPISTGDWAAMAVLGLVVTTVACGAGKARVSLSAA